MNERIGLHWASDPLRLLVGWHVPLHWNSTWQRLAGGDYTPLVARGAGHDWLLLHSRTDECVDMLVLPRRSLSNDPQEFYKYLHRGHLFAPIGRTYATLAPRICPRLLRVGSPEHAPEHLRPEALTGPPRNHAISRLKQAGRGERCFWCDMLISWLATVDSAEHATIDHVLPRCRGGGHDLVNIVASCKACNSARGNGSGGAGRSHGTRLFDRLPTERIRGSAYCGTSFRRARARALKAAEAIYPRYAEILRNHLSRLAVGSIPALNEAVAECEAIRAQLKSLGMNDLKDFLRKATSKRRALGADATPLVITTLELAVAERSRRRKLGQSIIDHEARLARLALGKLAESISPRSLEEALLSAAERLPLRGPAQGELSAEELARGLLRVLARPVTENTL